MRAVACGPLRPGKAITAAPLREGTYQPCSSSPSLVVKRTSSCGGAEVGGRHHGAGRVRVDVLHADRQHDEGEREHAGDAEQGAAGARGGAGCRPCRRVRQSVDGAGAEQHGRGGQREQAGVVVARQAGLVAVVEGLAARREGERAERQGERAAATAAQPRGSPRGEREQRERHEPGDEMIARGRTRLGLDERVVDHVQRDRGDAEPERGEAAGERAGTGPEGERGGEDGDGGGHRRTRSQPGPRRPRELPGVRPGAVRSPAPRATGGPGVRLATRAGRARPPRGAPRRPRAARR